MGYFVIPNKEPDRTLLNIPDTKLFNSFHWHLKEHVINHFNNTGNADTLS